ncbi:cation/H(+) antiporter 4-like isoform X1 [Rhododendron vialii]|uniref:cation/H(+) antiporter 4-like isoform X1 n=1 Tax=Rhododendron vialii TaxID=182163 RepID=UPI00265E64A5|nr:cation/H(+) antiporter 4-like isoform X1 [Rhododendron vialii]
MCLPFPSSQTNYPSLFGRHTIMNRISQTHYKFLSFHFIIPSNYPLSLSLSLSLSLLLVSSCIVLPLNFFNKLGLENSKSNGRSEATSLQDTGLAKPVVLEGPCPHTFTGGLGHGRNEIFPRFRIAPPSVTIGRHIPPHPISLSPPQALPPPPCCLRNHGVKMDPSMVMKSGKKAWTIGVVSMAFPIVLSLGVSFPLSDMVTWAKTPGIRFVVATQTLTPFPVVSRLLIDLQIMNSELGHLALASALIRELLSLILSTTTFYIRVGSQGSAALGIQALFMFLITGSISGFVARAGFLWIVRQTPEGKPVKEVHIIFISSVVLVSAIMCDNLGILYHYGPFLLGLFVPDGPPLGSTLVERLETLVSGWFAPLLLTYCGLHSDIFAVSDLRFQFILWTVLFGAIVVKFTANFVPALICKMPVKDAIALSLVLSGQGIVELAAFLAFRENETLDTQTFSTVAAAVCLTAIAIPLLVQSIYDRSRRYGGYQKRNILHSLENSELRILVTAHRPEDAMAAINLLEAYSPTKETPLAIYALHLMELVGRAHPILINHQLGQKATSSSASRSLPITKLFDQFELQYSGYVVVQSFTAISFNKFMHEDICSLAFEKLVSLIVLPFHRKWNAQGKVVFDNNAWRNMNRQVLQMAPCSVGVLVDRRKIQQQPQQFGGQPQVAPYRVAIVFLGGDDDREALAYAKRMAKSPHVFLTVVRFFAYGDDDSGDGSWDAMLDAEVLKDLRLAFAQAGNLRFREERVEDGPELALRVRSLEEAYDLIIVGRRHGGDSRMLAGLTEWVEFPELGPVGDILASADVNRPVSVLVVQQQLHLKIK